MERDSNPLFLFAEHLAISHIKRSRTVQARWLRVFGSFSPDHVTSFEVARTGLLTGLTVSARSHRAVHAVKFIGQNRPRRLHILRHGHGAFRIWSHRTPTIFLSTHMADILER